jgi:hypothetical protein
METEKESSPPHKATAVAKTGEEERGKECRNSTISQGKEKGKKQQDSMELFCWCRKIACYY